jgi:REP element-mobilizing transposase RayT
MARAKRHYVPDQIWHIIQRCHKREFLLKLNPPRGKPRGISTVRMKIDFQFAR